MVQFIDDNKHKFGIEPICRVLPIVPLTYYRAKDLADNPEKYSRRHQHDHYLIGEIERIWKGNPPNHKTPNK